jgi:uncharacterized repeat protein (TIGR01451 family)
VVSNPVRVKGVQNALLLSNLSAAETTFGREGDIIHYSIEVRNSGNVTLTNLKVTDAASGLTQAISLPGMVPGATSILSVQHVVTPADLAAGRIVNSASVTATNPAGERVSNRSNELTIVANDTENLILTKIAQESSYSKTGDVIHYVITLQNRGTVALSNITLAVPDATIVGSPVIPSLGASATATVLAIHTVTQGDLDAGQLVNAATASGRFADGREYTRKANLVSVYGVQDPHLSTRFSVAESSYSKVGEQINYTVEVKNTGNVTLSSIDLSAQDNLTFNASQVSSLAPGKSARLSATYTVTLADLDAGQIVKSVQALAKDPLSQLLTVSSNEASLSGIQMPELSAVAVARENSFSVVGETIHYSIRVTNSGNVSIISTAVTDPSAVIIDARPNIILLPGESFLVEAARIVTQNDLNSGKVVNAPKAEGFDLNGNTITKVAPKVTVKAIQHAELVVEADASRPNFKKVGETIDYNFHITNLGNTSVFDVTVSDPNAIIRLDKPVSVLLPGESIVMTASHIVTQEDMDAGQVVSLVKASATDLNSKSVTAFAKELTVNGLQVHELVTAAEASVPTYSKEGDVIGYTVRVTNTGNVTMRNISVADQKETVDFNGIIPTLAPGQSASVSSDYRVTLDDINAGKLVSAPVAACFDSNSLKFSFAGNDVTVRLAIENFNLSNFPNPFAGETTIVFDLPEKAEVIMKVYDMTGREIGQIEQKEFNQGRNYVNWKSNNAQKGLYVLRMISNGVQGTRILSIVN